MKLDDLHNYRNSFLCKKTFEGYNCYDEFCNWLFSEENAYSTVLAHNGGGYDYKFVLSWWLKHSMRPDSYIVQGSHISLMTFSKFKLRVIDTLSFFLSSLKKLSKTYNIDTVKGFFPHHFNTPENQNYVGKIPSYKEFGAHNMSHTSDPDNDDYSEFVKWYETVRNDEWDFKREFHKYCEADVELLFKAVLEFRKLSKGLVDVDPWRYTTLASL